jgi:hypothetical protein
MYHLRQEVASLKEWHNRRRRNKRGRSNSCRNTRRSDWDSVATQMQANHSVKIPGPKKTLPLAAAHEHFLVAKPTLPLHENRENLVTATESSQL